MQKHLKNVCYHNFRTDPVDEHVNEEPDFVSHCKISRDLDNKWIKVLQRDVLFVVQKDADHEEAGKNDRLK